MSKEITFICNVCLLWVNQSLIQTQQEQEEALKINLKIKMLFLCFMQALDVFIVLSLEVVSLKEFYTLVRLLKK